MRSKLRTDCEIPSIIFFLQRRHRRSPLPSFLPKIYTAHGSDFRCPGLCPTYSSRNTSLRTKPSLTAPLTESLRWRPLSYLHLFTFAFSEFPHTNKSIWDNRKKNRSLTTSHFRRYCSGSLSVFLEFRYVLLAVGTLCLSLFDEMGEADAYSGRKRISLNGNSRLHSTTKNQRPIVVLCNGPPRKGGATYRGRRRSHRAPEPPHGIGFGAGGFNLPLLETLHVLQGL